MTDSTIRAAIIAFLALLIIVGLGLVFAQIMVGHDRGEVREWEDDCRGVGFTTVQVGEYVYCRDERGNVIDKKFMP